MPTVDELNNNEADKDNSFHHGNPRTVLFINVCS